MVDTPPGWPGHMQNTWYQLGTTMLDTPWVARTRENTWFQLGANILDTPVGNLENHQPKKLCQVITHLVSIY